MENAPVFLTLGNCRIRDPFIGMGKKWGDQILEQNLWLRALSATAAEHGDM